MAYGRRYNRLDRRLSDDSFVFNIAFVTKQQACRRAETGRTNNIVGDAVARKRGGYIRGVASRFCRKDLAESSASQDESGQHAAASGIRRRLVSRLCCAQCVLYGPAKKRMMREAFLQEGVAVTSVNTISYAPRSTYNSPPFVFHNKL